MEAQLLEYFQGEQRGSIYFGSAGVVACLLSVLVWRYATHYRAMLYPLLIVAAIQIGVFFVIYFRTPGQVDKLLTQLRTAPIEFQTAEGKRMTGVNRSFAIIEIVEIVMLIGGTALCFLKRDDVRWFAVGMGLILQGAAMLVGDLEAHRRGDGYARAVAELRA